MTNKNNFIGNIFVHVFNNKRLFVNRDVVGYISKNRMYTKLH